MAAPWPEPMIAEARRLWEVEGYSASQVAHALDRDHRFTTTRSAICGLAHRRGWVARKVQLNRVVKPKKRRVARVIVEKPAPAPIVVVAPPPPPPPPKSAPDTQSRSGVGFFDIRDGMCRWPLWDVRTPFAEKRFCGELAPGPGPYCDHCRTLSFEPFRSAA